MSGSVATFLAGVLFAVGLSVAGMTNANQVLAFLNLGGDWDPSLALVMAGAIAVHAPLARLVRRRQRPHFGDTFHLPTKNAVDKRLVAGAAIFGVGWGLAGYCPGPAIVSAVWGDGKTVLFVVAMLAGMGAFKIADTFIHGETS